MAPTCASVGSPIMVRSTPAIFAALTALFVATRADAYCRSTVCKDIDACDGEEVPGCPPLYWPGNCVGYSVQQDGGSGLDADTVDLIADLAFDQWRGADCGGEKPGLFIQNFGQVQCHAVEYNNDATDAANANIVLFSDDWPHSEATHTFALTTTTYDPVTGELLNADIELNARDHHFTVNDDAIEADLLSVLTHETGHFLGLAHSEDTDATMFPFYEEGTTELRTLTADDMEGICAIYPPDPSIDASCNPLPRHGFSPLCRDDQNEGRCTISAPASRSTREALPFALVAAALAMRARSRFKRR